MPAEIHIRERRKHPFLEPSTLLPAASKASGILTARTYVTPIKPWFTATPIHGAGGQRNPHARFPDSSGVTHGIVKIPGRL
jgi:hypothetical protein